MQFQSIARTAGLSTGEAAPVHVKALVALQLSVLIQNVGDGAAGVALAHGVDPAHVRGVKLVGGEAPVAVPPRRKPGDKHHVGAVYVRGRVRVGLLRNSGRVLR